VFKTEREAAIEYNRLCKLHCPDYCVLNEIPETDTSGEDEDDGDGADTDSSTQSSTVAGVRE
jgi:hypothetical protein